MERICIVVPCYNEAQRLKLDAFREFLREQDDIDFCFVNDGSTDNTSEVLRRAVACCPERFLLVDNADNRGKAEAVRCGMSRVASLGRYDMIGFLDADLATPLEEIRLLADMMVKRPELCVTMGARLKRLGANVQRKAYRHYMGRVFATVVSLLFRMPVYDSQCGAKLFRAALVPELFKEPFSSGWSGDSSGWASSSSGFETMPWRYCISCHCSLVMSTCRALEPSKGPTIPRSSIWSTRRAARA